VLIFEAVDLCMFLNHLDKLRLKTTSCIVPLSLPCRSRLSVLSRIALQTGAARVLGRRGPLPIKWEGWASHFEAGAGRTPAVLRMRGFPNKHRICFPGEFDQDIDDTGIELSS